MGGSWQRLRLKSPEMETHGPKLDSVVLLHPPYDRLFEDGNLNIPLLKKLLVIAESTNDPVELRNIIDVMSAVVASLKKKYKWITSNHWERLFHGTKWYKNYFVKQKICK